MNSMMNVLPTPCTNVREKTVKDWFAKINEELDELKMSICFDINNPAAWIYDEGTMDEDERKGAAKVAEEAADTITAITSMLEAMGIDEEARQAAQKRVNEKNREWGRL